MSDLPEGDVTDAAGESQVHAALQDMEPCRMGNGSPALSRAVMHLALSAGAASTLAVTRGAAYS
jgi:hypothetical protein